MSIRGLTTGDIDQADPLLCAAFGATGSFAPRLSRYLAIEPGGWFAAVDGDTLVGMVGAIRYGSFAYLGLMAVDPARHGRGIGRQVIEHALAWLDAHGIACAVLEATPQGALLYERLGFVDVSMCTELRSPEPPPGAAMPPVAALEPPAQAEVIALDRDLFGAERAPMWRQFFAGGEPILIERDAAGSVAGYLCVQPTMLGPWGATSAAAAEALLARALPLVTGAPRRVQVPGENSHGEPMLSAAGFAIARQVRHMRRGELARAPHWRSIYGKASFCLG